MSNASAPKCKTCGVIEWRHICLGAVDVKEATSKEASPAPAKAGASVRKQRKAKAQSERRPVRQHGTKRKAAGSVVTPEQALARLEEIKAKTRARVQAHRARKKAKGERK